MNATNVPSSRLVRRSRLAWHALVFALFTAGSLKTLRADTATLIPVADAAMRSTSPDSNFGGSTQLPVGVSKGGSILNRGLFKFDLTVLPPNAVVTSATLRLIDVQNGTADANFDLHRLLADWSESDATWNDRLISTPWTAGGGAAGSDFVSAASVTASIGDFGSTNDFTSAGVAADVQRWINNPGTNFGWLLMATGEPAGTGKLIGSRENPDNTPLLVIEFTAPPPLAISNVARVGNSFRFTFNAQSNHTYAVEFLTALPKTNWATLTNVAAQPADTTISVSDPLMPSNRFYRVRTP